MRKEHVELVSALRSTRANMLGTDDEEHYRQCHEAADEIEHLDNTEEALLVAIEAASNLIKTNEDCARHHQERADKLVTQNEVLRTALQAASDHLNYCGYGDEWERECAVEAELPKKN